MKGAALLRNILQAKCICSSFRYASCTRKTRETIEKAEGRIDIAQNILNSTPNLAHRTLDTFRVTD